MRTLVLTALGCAAMAGLAAQNNKEEEKEPQTQTLELPKELPPAVPSLTSASPDLLPGLPLPCRRWLSGSHLPGSSRGEVCTAAWASVNR
jgi:hypothetical protein